MSVLIPSISDAFQNIVAATEDALIADTSLDWGTLPKKLYFLHGHPKEIVSVLQGYTNSTGAKKNQKYPLVALFRDIKEEVNQQAEGLASRFNCSFIICTLTNPSDRSNDRQEKNFKPILLPIFTELINQITLSESFGTPTVNELKITKWDRYFWGTQAIDKNILNDCVDAVEVESISLQLINNICSPLSINS